MIKHSIKPREGSPVDPSCKSAGAPVSPTGRFNHHIDFNHLGTVTGRFSAKHEINSNKPKSVIHNSDYSKIEARVFAHYCTPKSENNSNEPKRLFPMPSSISLKHGLPIDRTLPGEDHD